MAQDDGLADGAVRIAAKAAGLREDQVVAAIREYRHATDAVEAEPEWSAIMHMSGAGYGFHQYADPTGSTKVTLQVEEDSKKQFRSYILDMKSYKTFGEARQIEIERAVRPKPRVV